MKKNDYVKAEWSDGLIVHGVYMGKKQGYIILSGSSGQQFVCDPNSVRFEVVNDKHR